MGESAGGVRWGVNHKAEWRQALCRLQEMEQKSQQFCRVTLLRAHQAPGSSGWTPQEGNVLQTRTVIETTSVLGDPDECSRRGRLKRHQCHSALHAAAMSRGCQQQR